MLTCFTSCFTAADIDALLAAECETAVLSLVDCFYMGEHEMAPALLAADMLY